METWDFPYFGFRTKYPVEGGQYNLGGGYTVTTAPDAPAQRTFTLSLRGMQYYLDGSGDIDATVNTDTNMSRLENFYIAHKLHASFTFPHPVYGDLTVKFSRPLDIPEGIDGGNGILPSFELELKEQH